MTTLESPSRNARRKRGSTRDAPNEPRCNGRRAHPDQVHCSDELLLQTNPACAVLGGRQLRS